MTQPPDWDDDRLDAAFRDRFDRPAPQTLAKDIHVRIAGTTPARFGGLRVGRAWSLAAAAVVVVLVAGTAMVGLGGLGRTGGSPLPSDASASAPGPSATPTAQANPGSVFDLPVITVSDAIAIRDGGVDDRELAVLGWLRPAWSISCPLTPTVSPLQMECPDRMTWLTRDFEVGTVGRPFDPPVGPGFNPDLDGLDASWQPSDGTPIDVVLVGHFDDRRAELCPRAEIDACRDRFVVDSVAMVRGSTTRADRVSPTNVTTRSTAFDIEAIVANEAPQSQVLSMTIVDGATGLARVEPSLGTGQENLIDQPILWVVRVLESERVVTYVVVDGSDAIYEMNVDGDAVPVGGTPPAPGAPRSPAPWPPEGARVVVLTSEVGAGTPPVRVAVVDNSGRLTNVAEKGDVDPATISFDGRFGAYAEPGHPGRVHLTWVGSICDSQITVTVAADLGSISFDMGPPVDCDTIGVGRQLVLDFSGSVDVPSLQVGEISAVPSAAPPAAIGYKLDCGPLGPDTCASRAADILAATPTQRVVSIIFSDECGSYTALFDDGTGVSADIDCIRP